MRPVKMIAIGLLTWPLAEVVAFLIVATWVGVATALLLMILVSCTGVLILRHFGGRMARPPAVAGHRRFAALSMDETAMMPGLGGILLVIPGFITGVLGVLVLFPISRRWLLAACQRLFAVAPPPADPGIVDLAPNEWRPLPGRKLPHSDGEPKD